MENVKITRLENGLTVATDYMSHVETTSLGVWIGAGTRDETLDINGAAHFLEHMAFKGTERRSARDIAEEIEAVGGHLNAYTARENTAYYARVLSDDVPLAVDILADIIQNPVFDETEFERERSVILQEIGQCHDTPDDVIFDHFQQVAFPGQSMGWPVLGSVESVKGLSISAVQKFMRQKYAANKMILSAAGNIDHATLVDLARQHFTELLAKKDEKIVTAQLTSDEYREQRSAEQVHFVLGFPGYAWSDERFYAGNILTTVLGGGMSSRLFQKIREERGLVYSVYSFNWSFSDSGIFGVYAGTGENEVKELIPVLCDEIKHLGETITQTEIQRARTQIKAGLLMSAESTSSRAEQLAQQILIYGEPRSRTQQLAALEEVTRENVVAVAGDIFDNAPVMAALGPLSKLESFASITRQLKKSG